MEQLGVDYKLIIAQLVNFVLFYYIFKRFMAKPFLHFLHEEKRKETEKERLLSEIKKQEEAMGKAKSEMLSQMRSQIDQEIQRAKMEGAKIKESIIESAKKEADRLIAETKKQLVEEQKLMEREMKETTGKLSVLMVKKALSEYLTEDAKKQLTAYILKNISNTINQ